MNRQSILRMLFCMGLFIPTCLVSLITVSCESTAHNSTVYSQEMAEARALRTFFSNRKEEQLSTAEWDYVPGLVANSVLKAWVQYPEKTDYYETVKKYADYCMNGGDTVYVRPNNIDDLAAGKIFFALYRAEMEKGNAADAMRYKHAATELRNRLKYKHLRIDESKKAAGRFFHKAQYPDQLWLDGLYMGPALYAEWQHYFGQEEGEEENINSWTDIALQFELTHHYTFDRDKQLNYHVWAADPEEKSAFWAKRDGSNIGCSSEFWGRGSGWFFAALVDVLEWMPKTHPKYPAMVDILQQVAGGLAGYQDKESGCWHQLLQYDSSQKGDNIGDSVNGKVYNVCDKNNYLEASASSMFTYSYFKGIRLGLLDEKIYMPVAQKAYKGLIATFIRKGEDGNMSIIKCCASAGLGPANNPSRTGTKNDYLCGADVTVVENEGKAIGPFIMASLEAEMVKRDK